ncbi:hypothetical protein J4232_00660 [Candidatus Woesearchaeota archaeon]|nr:hypothetical protein [Candidatus Woesearchaeota archaeon]
MSKEKVYSDNTTMDNRYRFLRTSNRIINELNHFIDFRYSKHLTDVDQKKYLQLLLMEKQLLLLGQQLFMLREGLGRVMFNKVQHQLNIIRIKIARLKKKHH